MRRPAVRGWLLFAVSCCLLLVLYTATSPTPGGGYTAAPSPGGGYTAAPTPGGGSTAAPSTARPQRYEGAPVSAVYQPGWDVDSPAACRGGGAHLQLVVLVTSAPAHLDRRAAIRSTWGSLAARRDADLVFLLGRSPDERLARSVLDEVEVHGDVVVSRNVDAYKNLTLKTIAMTEWVRRRCPGARFFMKVDDDVFLNAPRLASFLLRPEVSSANRTIFGMRHVRAPPVRYVKSRYYVSRKEYPGDVYPDYMQGSCYLVSGDLSEELHSAALRSHFFSMEDVFLTGLLAEEVGAHLAEPPDLYDNALGMKKARQPYLKAVSGVEPCAFRAKVAIHNVDPQQMFRMWLSLFDRTLKC